MFARKVYARLKPNVLQTFIQLMEREIFPWLKAQEGFLDSIVLVAPDGVEVQVLSFWENRRIVDEHDATNYPAEVLKTLENLLDEITCGRTFEVVSSTLEMRARTEPSADERTPAISESGATPSGSGSACAGGLN